ncbi:MAG: polysaccharide biosynthesis protein [SAR324 cluster bacterium]|nr:polysaccharide biosynthesis protein [SAR324 cluster bacterium]
MSNSPKAVSAMIWDFLGKGILTMVRFAESIVLVRLMGNLDYGVLSVYLNLLATLLFLCSFGMEGVIGKFVPAFRVTQQSGTIKSLIRLAFRFRGAGVFLVILAGLLVTQPLNRWLIGDEQVLQSHNVALYLLIILATLGLGSFQELVRRILVTYYEQRWINLVDLICYVAYLTGAWIAVAQGWGVLGVLYANILAKAGLLIFFSLRMIPHYRKLGNSQPILPDQQTSIRQYAVYFYIYHLMLYALGKGADIFIIGAYAPDARQVTFYTIAYNFAFFAGSFFELALQGGFLLPFITEVYHQKNTKKLKQIYNGLFEFIYLFTIPMTVGGIVLSSEIVELFYGAENLETVPLLMLFFLHFAIIKVGVMNASFMLAMDQQKVLIQSRLFWGVVNVVVNLWLVQQYQAMGVVWGTLVTGLFASAYESWRLHQLIHPDYSLKFSIKVLSASFLMGAAVYGGGLWVFPLLIFRFSGLIVVGMLVYGFCLVWLKPISRENIEILQRSKLPLQRYWLKWFAQKS